MDPVERKTFDTNRKVRLESGLFRLSCPLLVKAIDEWERKGAVADINAELATCEGDAAELAAHLDEAHAEHSLARKEIVGDRLERVRHEAQEQGSEIALDRVLDSGIAGQTRSKLDIKCVHAQLADHLCRSGSNKLASELIGRLEARGTPVSGDDNCCAQCDVRVPETQARRGAPPSHVCHVRKSERWYDLQLASALAVARDTRSIYLTPYTTYGRMHQIKVAIICV